MLIFDLHALCKRNHDGSFATQSNRKSMLEMFVKQLARAGFNVKRMNASDLKGRHVNALLNKWKEENISTATIKNRMSVIRWWAEKIGNPGAVKSNDSLGVDRRVYATNENKAVNIEHKDISSISVNIRLSLLMQANFGLRREEAMKFQPEYALDSQSPNDAKYIRIKSSWAKGGRAREIPVRSDPQRKLLWEVIGTAKHGSLIPEGKTYKAHLSAWERETSQIGVGNTHGLRHSYAQNRYKEITGWDAPAVAGIRVLSADEKSKDYEARLIITEELGHSRLNVTNNYLGSWRIK